MATQPLRLRIATSDDAYQGAAVYRHDVLHHVLSVNLGLNAGPHVRVLCPDNRQDCQGLTAISGFLTRADAQP